MTEQEMLEFAHEQLEIFSKDSTMGKFLISVIKHIESDPKITFNATGNNNVFIDRVKNLTIN